MGDSNKLRDYHSIISKCVLGLAQDADITENRVLQPYWEGALKYKFGVGRGKSMSHFTHFWHKRQPHIQLAFSNPLRELLGVGTVLADTGTMLHAVFYSSLVMSDSTLKNPFGTNRSFKWIQWILSRVFLRAFLSSGAKTPFKDCSSNPSC